MVTRHVKIPCKAVSVLRYAARSTATKMKKDIGKQYLKSFDLLYFVTYYSRAIHGNVVESEKKNYLYAPPRK